MKKIFKAFTLAEVLVTLAIVGVIASLTVPSVIKNYQKKQMAVKLEKIYSTIERAINLAKIDYGDPKIWNWPEDNEFYNSENNFAPIYMKPYLSILKDFSGSKEANCYNKTKYCISISRLDGNKRDARYDCILKDGTYIGFFAGKSFFAVNIDINGEKGPNVWGKDVFRLLYWAGRYSSSCNENCSTNIYPKTKENMILLCRTKGDISTYCLDLIRENNWKVPNDYPW